MWDRKDIKQAREADFKSKEKQKAYKDAKNMVKPTRIKVGDKVLLSRNQTKANSPYDPDPFVVTKMHGSQIQAARGKEIKKRDAKFWKIVDTEERLDYKAIRDKLARISTKQGE